MDWVGAGIQLVWFVAELLVYLVSTRDGSSPGLGRAHRGSPAVPESMNRWAERQDAEMRAAMIARSKGGWRSSEEEPSWSPILATSSTSDPMWDRELDG